MSIVISAYNLSKKYQISHKPQQRINTLRDAFANDVKHAIQKIIHPRERSSDVTREEFWALQNVSFEIKQGDRVGIIGRNGAGKSTLLKILSRITEPTSGKAVITGRVASLLEVGTGFHPELTGRENIYLNGAILGMSKSEIQRRFDEIVDFAEVEKFLDTPVKHYSSGMYVRLAFSVAAHLEPEILIVDEVLAVGDAQFQKKCLGKLGNAGSEGRTVIFVSHNMNAIEQLCKFAICMQMGSIKLAESNVRSVINAYLDSAEYSGRDSAWVNTNNQVSNPWFFPESMEIVDINGNPLSQPVSNDKEVSVLIKGVIEEVDLKLTIGLSIYNEDGALLFRTYHTDGEREMWPTLKTGKNSLICRLPQRILNEGVYKIELIGCLYQQKWIIEPGASPATIKLSIRGGLSDSPYWYSKRAGILAPVLDWQNINPD